MNLAVIVEQLSASPQWGDFAAELRVGGETFHTTGLYIHDMGYLKVYVYDKWTNKTIPNYMQGEELVDYSLRMTDGRTQPPELLNEADLIALMDKFGIGTDATHAEHIEKIKTRQYVGVRNDGRFVPGFLGLALVDGYDAMGYAMSKPQLRADLERQLQAICAGERTKQEVLREQLEKYRRIFVQTEAKINLVSEALSRFTIMKLYQLSQLAHPEEAPVEGRVAQGEVLSPHLLPRVPNLHNSVLAVIQGLILILGRSRGSRAGATADQSTGVDVGRKQCACGVAAVQRTVQKDGPNKGKKFWTCSKPMGQPDKCNFFEWL
ncbi:unnamed protein product [Nippostrongylus brasiliensis]|uniref:DNA topoisomerase n=1 Tax=Nippostrongylus brasiliensis TaxID=27835 RepID=A0A158R0K5_NIPBR|nr:unnamed protein product [Nippostrongylus brasiliensis]